MDYERNGGCDAAGNVTKPVAIKRESNRKRWKKPKGMPKRPLSAYNLFFAHERKILIEERSKAPKTVQGTGKGKMGFGGLARNISSKWNKLTPEQKVPFQKLAAVEQKRYKKELQMWKTKHKEKSEQQPDEGDDEDIPIQEEDQGKSQKVGGVRHIGNDQVDGADVYSSLLGNLVAGMQNRQEGNTSAFRSFSAENDWSRSLNAVVDELCDDSKKWATKMPVQNMIPLAPTPILPNIVSTFQSKPHHSLLSNPPICLYSHYASPTLHNLMSQLDQEDCDFILSLPKS